MSDKEQYVVLSLELHLFFARIMKEHALFLEAGFTPANKDCAKEADTYKQKFESVLRCAASLGNGVVGRDVLCSGEVLTDFTATAEKQTQCFTGIPIDKEITKMESRLRCGDPTCVTPQLCRQVKELNQTALCQLDGLIAFKEKVLNAVLHCRMFTVNYPLLIEHIIHEAKQYRTLLCGLENRACPDCQPMNGTEAFWNHIMMEHALFIRGQLDPSENALIQTSGEFAQEYAALLAQGRQADNGAALRQESLDETLKFREFKTSGVKGIENCEIRSVILPLLADHVLREANHYIRVLNE